jgi:hypothetical protein
MTRGVRGGREPAPRERCTEHGPDMRYYCKLDLPTGMFANVKHLFNKINDEITKVIGWDLEVCERGVGPTHGFYGEPLTTGSRGRLAGKPLTWSACYAGMKADGKARRESHRFDRHYNSTWLCPDLDQHRCCTPPNQSKSRSAWGPG